LKTTAPQVAVQNGIVSLTGTVDSAKARHAAEVDARDTVGVWSVRDGVVVQPGETTSDVDLERGVRRMLADDLLIPDAKSIQVSTAKGKVTLTGK
jgi:osmotically-inducible protein OsmY